MGIKMFFKGLWVLIKSALSRDKNDPLFLVSRRPPLVTNGEQIDVNVVCPMCQTHWADVKAILGGPVSSESFVIKEPYVDCAKIVGGKPLVCPSCGYSYTNWAITALILAGMNRKNLDDKTNMGFRKFGQ